MIGSLAQSVSGYFQQMSQCVGQGWNRFWYQPSSPAPLALLRIGVALMAIYYVASFTPDLQRWFGPQGWFAPYQQTSSSWTDAMAQWLSVQFPVGETLYSFDDVAQPPLPPLYRLSYLTYASRAWELWVLHAAGLLVLVLFALGWKTRWMGVLGLVVVLAYLHRAPLLNSQLEPVLAMLMFYLALSPCGACWSLDRWLARKKDPEQPPAEKLSPRWSATVARRLIQVHLIALYTLIVLVQLSGGGTGGMVWWTGEAMWWIVARPETALVSADWLAHHPLLMDLWTYFVILFQLTFVVLVWVRPLRPLMLALAVVFWFSIALATGQVAYSALMLLGLVVFLPEELFLGRPQEEQAAAEPGGETPREKAPA